MTSPPPLPEDALHPKTAYVALQTREDSRILADVLKPKHYRPELARHYGRGSDVFALTDLRTLEPVVAFLSRDSDKPNVIEEIERRHPGRALKILTVDVNYSGKKGFHCGNRWQEIYGNHFALLGAVRGRKVSADYVVEGGLDSVLDFAENHLDMIVREEQKRWRQWVAAQPDIKPLVNVKH